MDCWHYMCLRKVRIYHILEKVLKWIKIIVAICFYYFQNSLTFLLEWFCMSLRQYYNLCVQIRLIKVPTSTLSPSLQLHAIIPIGEALISDTCNRRAIYTPLSPLPCISSTQKENDRTSRYYGDTFLWFNKLSFFMDTTNTEQDLGVGKMTGLPTWHRLIRRSHPARIRGSLYNA